MRQTQDNTNGETKGKVEPLRPILPKSHQVKIEQLHPHKKKPSPGDTITRLTHQAVTHSEAIYRRIIEIAKGVPYIMRMPEGKYEFIGSGAEEMFGLPVERIDKAAIDNMCIERVITCANPSQNLIERHKAYLRGDTETVKKRGALFFDEIVTGKISNEISLDLCIRTPQGDVKWLSDYILYKINEKTKKVTGSLGFFQDITDRKLAEQKIQAANQQLNAREQQLRATNQQLRAHEQQLESANQQLNSREQQLRATNQQLRAHEQQLEAANQQLNAREQQLRATNQQLRAHEQQLESANQQLQAREQQLRTANQQLRIHKEDLGKINHDLTERVKNLNCLYGISDILQKDQTLSKMFRDALLILPDGWHYPQITRTRIYFDDEEFVLAPFEPTQRKLSADIMVSAQKRGKIEVFYLEPRPQFDEGPFQKEERDLIDAIAQTISLAVERHLVMEKLKQAKADAESASKAKSQFLANMSHEIRTPLNAIIGISKTLSRYDESNLSPKEREGLEIVYRSSQRLLLLINGILDLSKIESGKMDMKLRPISIDSMIADVRSMAATLNDKSGVYFLVEKDDSVPATIVSDSQKLHEILTNIVGNAIKFTQSGQIVLKIWVQSDRLCFSVSDTGIGIAQNDLDRVFEEFTQLDSSTTRKYQGTGLGLAISKKLVELLGGKIEAQSKLDQGTIVNFYIPLKTPEPDSNITVIEKETTKDTEIKTQPRESLPKVLIAEDDQFGRAAIKIMLENRYKLIFAKDGNEVVDMYFSTSPDLVLMDIMMPFADGYEAFEQICKKSTDSTVPIIALTAKAMKNDREELLSFGFTDYIPKPIDDEALIKTIEKHLPKK
ncbi:MAG: PAS domain-containing hybrid sensor histidine kinase/response regulator [Planctomycetota bacterium]|jgi:signal transduction histidine kinase/ActR/RegA family two-component response regulator